MSGKPHWIVRLAGLLSIPLLSACGGRIAPEYVVTEPKECSPIDISKYLDGPRDDAFITEEFKEMARKQSLSFSLYDNTGGSGQLIGEGLMITNGYGDYSVENAFFYDEKTKMGTITEIIFRRNDSIGEDQLNTDQASISIFRTDQNSECIPLASPPYIGATVMISGFPKTSENEIIQEYGIIEEMHENYLEISFESEHFRYWEDSVYIAGAGIYFNNALIGTAEAFGNGKVTAYRFDNMRKEKPDIYDDLVSRIKFVGESIQEREGTGLTMVAVEGDILESSDTDHTSITTPPFYKTGTEDSHYFYGWVPEKWRGKTSSIFVYGRLLVPKSGIYELCIRSLQRGTLQIRNEQFYLVENTEGRTCGLIPLEAGFSDIEITLKNPENYNYLEVDWSMPGQFEFQPIHQDLLYPGE